MADILFLISGSIAVLGLLIAAFRFFMGPGVADRVIAFDVMTIIAISLIAYIAHLMGRIIYLDVAVVYGLLSFLGVIVIARYMERGL